MMIDSDGGIVMGGSGDFDLDRMILMDLDLDCGRVVEVPCLPFGFADWFVKS